MPYQFTLAAGATPIYMPSGLYSTSIANFILPNEMLRIWSDGTDWYVAHVSGPKAAAYYAAPTPLTAGASPYSYTASVPGTLYVSGGTVSSITIKRGSGGTAYPTGETSGGIKMGTGDVVTVTYTSAPTVTFFPD